MAVHERAGGTPASTGGLAGPILAVVGGVLVAASAWLPWVQITFQLPNGQGTFERTGLQLTNGVLVLLVGGLTALMGGGMAIVGASRASGSWAVAAAAALAVALTGAWWFRGYGTALTALGVLVCLAAAALSNPGPAPRRLWLLLGGAAAGIVGAVVLGILFPFESPTF